MILLLIPMVLEYGVMSSLAMWAASDKRGDLLRSTHHLKGLKSMLTDRNVFKTLKRDSNNFMPTGRRSVTSRLRWTARAVMMVWSLRCFPLY